MNTPSHLKTAILAALVPALMLTGCTSDDQFNTRAQGAGAGAVVGAGVGALLGSLSGNAGRGALIGAAVGTAGGLAYGDHVARKKAAYRNTEDYLDACIVSARRVNEDAYAYNRSLSNRIASLERQIRVAVAARDRAAIRNYQREVASLQSEARGQVRVINEEITIQRQVISSESGSPGVSTLRSEVSRLESARATTNSNVERLAALNNQMDI